MIDLSFIDVEVKSEIKVFTKCGDVEVVNPKVTKSLLINPDEVVMILVGKEGGEKD